MSDSFKNIKNVNSPLIAGTSPEINFQSWLKKIEGDYFKLIKQYINLSLWLQLRNQRWITFSTPMWAEDIAGFLAVSGYTCFTYFICFISVGTGACHMCNKVTAY